MKMTKKELTEVLEGVVNQLNGNQRLFLLYKLIGDITPKHKKELLEYFQNEFPTDTKTSLLENGIIEED